MQPRLAVAIPIFLASYLPLSIILLFQDLDLSVLARGVCRDPWHGASACDLPFQHPWASLSSVAICFGCLFLSLAALAALKPKHEVKILSSKHVAADLMNYTLPYVVAFTTLDYTDVGKLLGFLVFFAWMFVITLRSGQLGMNPVLIVFGWRLHEIEYQFTDSDQRRSALALSQVDLVTGATHRQEALQDMLIIKEPKGAKP
jgi:hypothetical protein